MISFYNNSTLLVPISVESNRSENAKAGQSV